MDSIDTSGQAVDASFGQDANGEDEQLYGYEPQSEPFSERAEDSMTSSRRYARRINNVTAEKAAFDVSYHPRRVLLYAPPRQRRKWGDSDALPRINWGDLFFDLFYVAGTYNVSYILTDSPTWRGLLYAAGTFLPIMAIWGQRTVFDARYVTEADIFHRLTNILLLCILGVAVLFIRPVKILSNSTDDPSMMAFSLMLILERVWAISQYCEVYWRGVGQKEMRPSASRDARSYAMILPFYIAAFCVAATKFFGSDGGSERRLAASTSEYESSETSENDIPIILLLCGLLTTIGIMTTTIVCCFPKDGSHKEVTVPLNIDFTIHRNGEWTMLMLGESVFSLLIVDVDQEGNYYRTVFFAGVLTIILLQILHFQAQPHGAEDHASRRNKDAGIYVYIIFHFYSLALVVLGAAFTFFLTFADQYDSARRHLASYSSGEGRAAATLFGGALAVIFLSLDISSLLHEGWRRKVERIPCGQRWLAFLIFFTRMCLVVFVATLGLWNTQPRELVLIGVFSVLAQLLLRKVDVTYLSGSREDPHSDDNKHASSPRSDSETGEAQWPNVTHARVEEVNHDPPNERHVVVDKTAHEDASTS